MYKLTEKRLEEAHGILEKYREQLRTKRYMDSSGLDAELRQCWQIWYQQLKDIMIDMLSNERYKHVAAFYMQHQNAIGPVSEFKPHLAELYGTDDYDHFDKDGSQKAYWDRAFNELAASE
jgi:hypothetical protein